MQEFDEAKKIYLNNKEQHDALLQEFDKRLAGKPLAEAWKHPNVRYRMSVRKMHAEIEANEDLLAEAKRKFARAIKLHIESQPHLAAAREALAQIFWARVLAGIQIEYHQLIDEYFKKLSDDELRQRKPKFLADYGLD